METSNTTDKKPKPKNKALTTPVRVRLETRKRILQEVAKANKKDFGKRIRVEDLISLALTLVEPRHIQELQDGSLSNADRLERDYRSYAAKHGPITKDAYLGKRLSGELAFAASGTQSSETKTST